MLLVSRSLYCLPSTAPGANADACSITANGVNGAPGQIGSDKRARYGELRVFVCVSGAPGQRRATAQLANPVLPLAGHALKPWHATCSANLIACTQPPPDTNGHNPGQDGGDGGWVVISVYNDLNSTLGDTKLAVTLNVSVSTQCEQNTACPGANVQML